MDVGARPRYDVKVAPGAALLSFLAALKEAAPALFPFSESADTTSGRCLAVEGLHGELLCIGSQLAFDTALTSFARDDGTIRVTTLPASSLRAPSRRKRPSQQLTQASTATSSAPTTRGKSRGGDATVDHLQCSFCKLYGHGREGQGALMFACRIRGERQFAHEYCLFLAPKVYFNHHTGKLVNVASTMHSKQFRAMTCPECKHRGTTIGCPVKGCDRSYHLLCALKAGFKFTGTDGWKFYCRDHWDDPGAANALPQATSLSDWTALCDTSNMDVCEICLQWDEGESMLECDVCELGYHMACLSPQLTSVPEGTWLCPKCQRHADDSKTAAARAGSGASSEGGKTPGASGAGLSDRRATSDSIVRRGVTLRCRTRAPERCVVHWQDKPGATLAATTSKKLRRRQYFTEMAWDDVELKVGDAVEICERGASLPHVAVVAALWVTPHGRPWLRAHWFYRPADTPLGRKYRRHRGSGGDGDGTEGAGTGAGAGAGDNREVFATLLGDPWSAQDVDVRCVDRVVRAVWMPGGGDGDAAGDRDEDMDADYVYSRVYRPATKKFESCPAPMPQLRLR